MLQEMTVYLKSEVDQLLLEKDTEIAQLKQRIAELENGSPEPTTPDLPEVTYEVQGNDLLIKVTNGHARAWDIWSDRAKRTIPPVKADFYLYQNAATGEKFSVHWSDLPNGLSETTFEYWTPDYVFSPGLDTEGNGPVVIIPEQPPVTDADLIATLSEGDGSGQRPDVGGYINNGWGMNINPDAKEFNVYRFMFQVPTTRDLNSGDLNKYEDTINNGLAKGKKGYIRFGYHYEKLTNPEPAFAQILRHVAQVGPFLHKIRSGITCVDFAWLGLWGENHSDKYSAESVRQGYVTQIKQVMDAEWPGDLTVCVRFAKEIWKQGINPQGWFDKALTLADAYNPKKISYSMHVDSWGAVPSEGSTWWPFDALNGADANEQRALAWATAQEAYYCGEPVPVGYRVPWDVSQDVPLARQGVIDHVLKTGTSLLNLGGNAKLKEYMQKDAALYRRFLASLGYNLTTKKVAIKTEGKKLLVSIDWLNTGSSGMHNPRSLYLMLDGIPVELASDMRKTIPRGQQAQTFTYQGLLPDLAAGRFRLGLKLKDAIDDNRFAVQLNNKGMGFKAGINDLGISLVVS